jgi:acetylglutamate kinase
MVISTQERSEILIQALPYIQKYNDKIVVIKYGGNAMLTEDLKVNVMRDIVLLHLVGMKVVLVHGGGPEITEMLSRIGKKTEFVNGLRVTDKESAMIVTMVLAGKINKELVGLLQNIGGKAIGVSGVDAHLIEASMMDEKLGYVGNIDKINPGVLIDLLSMGYIPVVSTVGYDHEGNTYNVNADTAAAEIAGKLNAEALISMTDIPGILMDKKDESTLIRKVDSKQTQTLIEEGVIDGGMIPKVTCCLRAVELGVKRVFILDGRSMHSILIELLTDEGIGTMFVQ